MGSPGPTSDTAALADGIGLLEPAFAADLGAGSGGVAGFVPAAEGPVWLLVDLDLAALSSCRIEGALRVCCDVSEVPSLMAGGIADLVTSNPPYGDVGRSRQPQGMRRRLERLAGPVARSLFARAASHLLRAGGEYRTVNRPQALEEMLVSCRAFGMEAFEIQPFGEPSRPAGLVRLRAVKGGGRRRLRLLPQRPLPGSGSGGAE